ncbi:MULTISPECIES: glycoside hydrolase family 36 protein [unclassified Enterococcus]|uniref:glycoside hydrolase family 36 protein n=1 Tax=unclassified Enterococcus TaxID=2608891 RepID=UPI001554BC62|nr:MULTISPECIES: glycoside hydrolase family 36 protein [unclassified Enterococcus]MBS7576450.1 alpha-galactosidase [Enterococcus sp. MMGLQ5-2]MBS7583682.1 alpha-galactosidase [Enterococcus sp. MMGLQ5-1]NPD11543.1 alpha-galactosidase [Enterococcus sp. MMGLQ5-1]NPD36287.1 alpha-galactosidase [Enterococcus sp. MMGLQ5-2]
MAGINKDKAAKILVENAEYINVPMNHFQSGESFIWLLDFKNYQDQVSTKYTVTLAFPIQKIAYFWHPTKQLNLNLPMLWEEVIVTKSNYSIPVYSFLSQSGKNRLTIAISEISSPVTVMAGVQEESASIIFQISIDKSRLKNAELKLYLSSEEQLFSKAIMQARDWLYQVNEIQPSNRLAKSFEMVFSSWYAFHQAINAEKLERELAYFKQYHLNTLILDDGWQTNDSNRGYQFAGDWQFAIEKFPNIKNHVKKFQAQDCHYLLWLSLPFIGKKSNHWAEFKNSFLYIDDAQGAGILDPRFAKTRQYMIDQAINLVKLTGVDGLKLDFLDVFYTKDDESFSDEWDVLELESAIELLLYELHQQLEAIQPNLMIEFRENYFGPIMNQTANIFRVKDCPNDFIMNRTSIAKLRLLCPTTAIHSDMLMWHADDTVEYAALQIENCIFGIPQISVQLSKLTEEHQLMLAFWTSYLTDNSNLLNNGEYFALNPQHQFNLQLITNRYHTIIACYEENLVIDLSEIKTSTIDIINATENNHIYIYSSKKQSIQLQSLNCMGVTQYCSDQVIINALRIDVLAAGMIKITKKEEKINGE